MARKSKITFGTVIVKEADVYDTPNYNTVPMSQFNFGKEVIIVSKADKTFYGIQVSPSIIGYIPREAVKVD